MENKLKLRDNDRVAIIGAGPAGSLFAYSLLRLARRQNLHLQVELYDPRDFCMPGPSGCNKGAGVLSGSLSQRLKRIGIDPDTPDGPVRRVLRGYLWNSEIGCLRLEVPPGWEPVRTVFRGAGPLSFQSFDNVSFDDFLLRHALEQGARHIPARVQRVNLPSDRTAPVRLSLQDKDRNWQIEAQLVVGAFGLHSHLLDQVAALGIGYCRPRWVRVAQAALPRRPDAPRQLSDDFISIFDVHHQRVNQLILTPKGDYATLTLLGPEDLHSEDLQQIRNSQDAAQIFAAGWDWPEQVCCCFPRLEQKSARNFFADRLVLIGDAACCKYYKNGLESALHTAEAAAETVFYHGIGRKSFQRYYYTKIRREIIHDNFFGRVLLGIHQEILHHPYLSQLFIQHRAALARSTVVRHYDHIIWDLFTGNRSYRHIFYRMLDLNFFLSINLRLLRVLEYQGYNTVHHLLKKYGGRLAEKYSLVKKRPGRQHQPVFDRPIGFNTPGQVHKTFHFGKGRISLPVIASGSHVSIIGGGPAGASCAIALMRQARKLNIQLDVTIHEPKDFITAAKSYVHNDDKRFNQCTGVMSPPIYEIVTNTLGIAFPEKLVQKHILGYKLHGQEHSLTLNEPYGSSYAMRRITFDAYMMQQTIEHGCHLNLATMLDLKPSGSTYEVITTNGTVKADVIVGAFGVDQAAADIFERCFDYRRPEYMQTIITKRHPSPDFIKQFGLRIHAFLPPLKAVEFGAITPKFNHLTINIAGRKVDTQTIYDFLSLPQVAQLLPSEYREKGQENYYSGCFPTSPARNFFADRMVVIGDASGMLRPFKGKGINAAIISGCTAAAVMMHRGLGAADFQRYYYPVFHSITEDIWYARTARWLNNILANHGAIDTLLGLASESKTLRDALTDAVSGACPYKSILKRFTHERLIWRSSANLLKTVLRN